MKWQIAGRNRHSIYNSITLLSWVWILLNFLWGKILIWSMLVPVDDETVVVLVLGSELRLKTVFWNSVHDDEYWRFSHIPQTILSYSIPWVEPSVKWSPIMSISSCASDIFLVSVTCFNSSLLHYDRDVLRNRKENARPFSAPGPPGCFVSAVSSIQIFWVLLFVYSYMACSPPMPADSDWRGVGDSLGEHADITSITCKALKSLSPLWRASLQLHLC